MKRLCLLLFIFLFSSLSWAVVEYGQLSGVVSDNQGAPLPGATVILESEAMIGGARTVLSNETGEFLFIQLRPGEYTVTCSMEGFQSVKNEKVKVSLDRTTKIIVKLQAAAEFQETVVVTGQAPVVDPTQTNIGDVYDATYLQETAIGSGGRSFQSVLTQSGGVTGAGNVSVFGSTGSENNYLIDGLSSTDPVTATFGSNFNFDAIQEISFQTGGFEAEYGQATGGIVNLVTRSGSNAFEGAFDIRYANQRFYEGSSKYPTWDPYDPSKDESSFYNPAFSLGGPIVKDKVWFFLSVQDEQAKTTPAGLDYSYKWDGQNYMGKVTWQLSPNDTLIGKWSSDPAKIHNWNAGPSTAKEAGARQDQGGNIYQLDYSRILTESMLFSAKVGVNKTSIDGYPESGDLTTPPYYFLDQYYSYNNYYNAQFSDRNRTEGLFSLTYFKNNMLGDHTIKVGGEYHDVDFSFDAFTPGDRSYYTTDYTGDGKPDAYLRYNYGRVPPYKDTGKQWVGYIQDEWRVLPNLVIKPGLRYDVAQYWNEVNRQVADFKKWQPRIGIAWDVFNNTKTVLRAYYGDFMHPSALTLPDFLRASGSSLEYSFAAEYLGYGMGMTAQEYCDLFGTCDSEGYVLAGEGFGLPNEQQKNLRPTYARQYSIGFEQEIAPRTGIEVNFIQKRTNNIMEDTCGGYDADGNFIDPIDYINDPDAYYPRSNFYDKCQFFYMRNNPFAKRYYYGYVTKFETRYKDWFHILFDYTYSVAKESVGDTQNAGGDFDTPITYLNRYGNAPGDNRHYIKLNGYFYLPYKFTIGFNSFFRSGRPYTKYATYTSAWGGEGYFKPPASGGYTYYLEPRGSSGTLPNVWWIDFQASWGFKITEGFQGKLIASVNNLTNNQAALARCTRWGSTNPNEEGAGVGTCGALYYLKPGEASVVSLDYGQDAAWQAPRSYEVGLRLEF